MNLAVICALRMLRSRSGSVKDHGGSNANDAASNKNKAAPPEFFRQSNNAAGAAWSGADLCLEVTMAFADFHTLSARGRKIAYSGIGIAVQI